MEYVQPIVAPRSFPLRLAASVIDGRAVWTMADQGIVSLGNFLSGVIVARALPEAGYGTYALLLETMLFLNSLQAAVVNYPLSIRAAGSARNNLGQQASACLWVTLAMLVALGSALSVAVIAGADHTDSGVRLVALIFAAIGAMLLWQTQETLRRAMMSELRFAACIPGDALSYLGQVALLALAASAGTLTLPTAFLIIAISSAAGVVVQALQIGLARVSFRQTLQIAKEYWKLGRWAMLASLAILPSSVGYTWTLRMFRGLGETGDYAAMIVPLKLANPLLLGMLNLMVPAVATASRKRGVGATASVVGKYALLGGFAVITYYMLLFAFPSSALATVFGHDSPYVDQAPWLRFYLINMCLVFVELVLTAWLNGLGESRANFMCQALQAGVTVLIGLPATALYGIPGLIAGGLIATAVSVLMQIYLLRRTLLNVVDPSWPPVRAFAE